MSSYPPQPPQPPPQPPWVVPTTRNNPDWVAVTSLVLGIISLLTSAFCAFVGLPFGVGAIVAGIVSMGRIRASQSTLGGGPFAVAGIVTGALGMLSTVLVVAYLAYVVGSAASGH